MAQIKSQVLFSPLQGYAQVCIPQAPEQYAKTYHYYILGGLLRNLHFATGPILFGLVAESLVLQGFDHRFQLLGRGPEGFGLLLAQGDFQHGLHPVLAHHGRHAQGQAL